MQKVRSTARPNNSPIISLPPDHTLSLGRPPWQEIVSVFKRPVMSHSVWMSSKFFGDLLNPVLATVFVAATADEYRAFVPVAVKGNHTQARVGGKIRRVHWQAPRCYCEEMAPQKLDFTSKWSSFLQPRLHTLTVTWTKPGCFDEEYSGLSFLFHWLIGFLCSKTVQGGSNIWILTAGWDVIVLSVESLTQTETQRLVMQNTLPNQELLIWRKKKISRKIFFFNWLLNFNL